MDEAEALFVAVLPLEVVHQRPDEVAPQVDPGGRRLGGRREVLFEILTSGFVVDGSIDDLVRECRSAFGDVRPVEARSPR